MEDSTKIEDNIIEMFKSGKREISGDFHGKIISICGCLIESILIDSIEFKGLYYIEGEIFPSPKKGDIILFKSNADHYVLHRILKIKKDKIMTAGDYNYFKDQPITNNQVLGKLVSIKKIDGKEIDLSKDKKARKFFYTNFFHIKAFFQMVGKVLHLRKVK